MAARVAAAREIQRARYAARTIRTNAEAEGELLDEIATPDAAGRKLLAETRPSACGCRRGAITACCGWRAPSPTWRRSAGVRRVHVAEALSYRRIAPARS